MPILWRYLISNYLKVFVLCTTSFIALLLTLRLSEVAYFATLGPEALKVLWFALQQIIYILPIAFPISALISAVLLVQNFSRSKELTAMRSCGFSLFEILLPVLATALFLSSLNFYIISELATTSHYAAGQLKNQLRSVNPLLIINNSLMMRIRGFYFDAYGPTKLGEFAQDIIFLSPNAHGGRLNLMVAKRLEVSMDILSAERLTLITSRQEYSDDRSKAKEQLMVENMISSKTKIGDFSQLLEKKIWTLNNDHLPLPQLLVRKDEYKKNFNTLLATSAKKEIVKEARDDYYRTITEIMRRFSASMAVFSFTLMGLAFGINISRSASNKNLFLVVFFAALYLVSFFIAKSFSQAVIAAAFLYFLPHVAILTAAFWSLKKTTRGIE